MGRGFRLVKRYGKKEKYIKKIIYVYNLRDEWCFGVF